METKIINLVTELWEMKMSNQEIDNQVFKSLGVGVGFTITNKTEKSKTEDESKYFPNVMLKVRGRKNNNSFTIISHKQHEKRVPSTSNMYYQVGKKDHHVLGNDSKPNRFSTFVGSFKTDEDYKNFEVTLGHIQQVTGQDEHVTSIKKECMSTLLENCSQFHFDNSMEKEEYTTIQEMNNGGILHFDKSHPNLKGYTKFDINSAYLHCLSKFGVFPSCPCKMVTTEQLDGIDISTLYGLYNLKVNSEGKDFVVNSPNDTYTHIDVQCFNKMGVTYQLVEDATHMVYQSTFDFSEIFSKQIEPVFKLKQQSDTKVYAKEYLLKLWGSACEKECKKVSTDTFFEQHDMDDVLEFAPDGESVFVKMGKFIYPFLGRMKPFLLSTCRAFLLNSVVKIQSLGFNIARLYVDSIACDMPAEDFDKEIGSLDSGIGNWKIEGVYTEDDYFRTAALLNSKYLEQQHKRELRKAIKEHNEAFPKRIK